MQAALCLSHGIAGFGDEGSTGSTVGGAVAEDSLMSDAGISAMSPLSKRTMYGSFAGSTGSSITVAETVTRGSVVEGTKTVWFSLKGAGRCRMESRLALEVKVNDPSYSIPKDGPAIASMSNLCSFPSTKVVLVGG